jgi:hypothetical protein
VCREAAAGQDKAPLSAAQAVTIILDGVRSGSWRILGGEDAKTLDALVRANLVTTPSWAGWRQKRPRQRHRSGSPPHMPRTKRP